MKLKLVAVDEADATKAEKLVVPVKVGPELKTRTPPVPVSSEIELERTDETAVVVACDALPKKRAREAVRFEKVFE